MRPHCGHSNGFQRIIALLGATVFFLTAGCDATDAGNAQSDVRLTLLYPPDAAQTADALQLEWNSTSTVNQFQVQVATDPGFTDTIVDDRTGNIPRKVLRDLEKNADYYWRVRLLTDSGPGSWIGPRVFTPVRDAVLPGKPTLMRPENGRTGLNRELRLEWEVVPDAIAYHLQVYFDEELLLFQADLVDLQKAEYEITDLVFTYPYWWRVRAESALGYGPWSTVWKFQVKDGV